MIRLFALAFLLLAAAPAFAADGKVLNVQKIITPGGIEVWLAEDKTVPVISMRFSFEGGLLHDPDDKPGVGRLVSILLDEGAGDLKSQEFQTQLTDNAIAMGFMAGRDAFTGSLKTLTANKDKAFALLKLALTRPRFDADAIERMRNANIAEIKSNLGDPDWLAARVFNGTLFEGHPYAAPGYGTLASMGKITRDDLVDFIRAQFAREGLKVSIAGDIDSAEAAKAVDGLFAAMPDRGEPVNTPRAELHYPGKTLLLPLDSPQTVVLAGEAGLARTDKDWEAANVMNHILGGGFGARLMREIREKRGLTYGIGTSLTGMTYTDLLSAQMSASNEKTAEAVALLRQEWGRFAAEGPTEEEVRAAKSYLTGSLPLALTSTDDIAAVLNDLQRDNLDYDYINKRNALIGAVTAADVKRVAARLLKPENLTVILVGQPQGMISDIMLDGPPGMDLPKKP